MAPPDGRISNVPGIGETPSLHRGNGRDRFSQNQQPEDQEVFMHNYLNDNM
jgi:hypothetical protein